MSRFVAAHEHRSSCCAVCELHSTSSMDSHFLYSYSRRVDTCLGLEKDMTQSPGPGLSTTPTPRVVIGAHRRNAEHKVEDDVQADDAPASPHELEVMTCETRPKHRMCVQGGPHTKCTCHLFSLHTRSCNQCSLSETFAHSFKNTCGEAMTVGWNLRGVVCVGGKGLL